MYGTLGQNDADRTLSTHSIGHIEDEYQWIKKANFYWLL